jgi:hypothetical protein
MQSGNGHIAFQLSVGPMHLVVHELINYATCSSQNKQGCGSRSTIISVNWIRIRIRIKDKIQQLERLNMESWMLLMEALRLKMELRRVCRPGIADLTLPIYSEKT